MDKQALRERVWDDLEASGVARFPFPPHGRIPNFAGADDAADRLAAAEEWAGADVVKANPDAPQLPVRRAALRAGKTLYVAVPRLRDPECFLRLDPREVEDYDAATTVSGISEYGVPVGPADVEFVDLVVSGSVAVSPGGARVGKGEGYSDLEFALLAEFGAVGDDTAVATTVHGRQVRDEEIRADAHDVPLDLIVTPERTLRPERGARPAGIRWAELDEERREEIPVLERLDGA
ncbi:MAG: 5-formyltetrahydrofolate cyclo-ligase [Halobacteriaceae archaeon]